MLEELDWLRGWNTITTTIGAMRVNKGHQFARLQGLTIQCWSRSPLKQEARRGGTRRQLVEIHQLSKDLCQLLFLNSNLFIKPRVKRWPRSYDKRPALSPCQLLHLHHLHILYLHLFLLL